MAAEPVDAGLKTSLKTAEGLPIAGSPFNFLFTLRCLIAAKNVIPIRLHS